MDQNIQSDSQYFTDYTQYSNYYNYSYYNYYQEQIPDHFYFTNKNEDSVYSASPNFLSPYSSNMSASIDNSDFSNNSPNYGIYYSFNENQNYSYNNDSAYQTQLETSSLQFNNYYLYENITSSTVNHDERKRPRSNGENFNFSHESQIESNKRPKILKLNIEENSTDIHYCDECGLSFNSKAKFLLHQFKAHKNGSSCVCPVCYKKFGNQANTLVHLRGHTQEKTYKCTQCSHAFYDSSTLKKHLRTHTGEKPYKCHLCTKKFTQSGNLKRHLLVHKKYDEDLKNENCLISIGKNVQYEWSKYSTDQFNQSNNNFNELDSFTINF